MQLLYTIKCMHLPIPCHLAALSELRACSCSALRESHLVTFRLQSGFCELRACSCSALRGSHLVALRLQPNPQAQQPVQLV